MPADPTTLEVLTAIFTGIGGIGAAVGAGAAWKAATASSQAAREARDAMALATQPHVDVVLNQWGDDSKAVSARAFVTFALADPGTWPATDVLIQFELASGNEGSRSVPLLEQGSHPTHPLHPPYLEVVIAEPSEDWPPPEGDRVHVSVLFSDVRRVASYRLSMAAILRPAPDGAVSIQITEPPSTTRVDRPGLSES